MPDSRAPQAFDSDTHDAFVLEADGPVGAVLVHGFPGSPDEMRALGQSLYQHGLSVHGMLLPGFGRQIETLARRGYQEWVAAVVEATQAARQRYQRVVVMGNSMGGALSILAAAQQPPDALVLIAPFYTFQNALWPLVPFLRVVLPVVKPFKLVKANWHDPEFIRGVRNFLPNADLNDPDVRRQISELEVPLAVFDQLRQTGLQAYKAAPQVAVPTLAIQGDQDPLVTPANTKKLIGRMAGRTTYIEVPAAHNPLQANGIYWGGMQSAILDFVREVLPA